MIRLNTPLGDDAWRFGQVPRRGFNATNVYDLPAVEEWLPATVPGNIRTDLLTLGRIPDPFLGEQYKESLWVEDVDWWYRRRLDREPLAAGQRAFLVFEGIDYLSAIFVNGRERTRREGMFSRQVVEISRTLQSGTADLAVRLWGSSALPRRQLSRRQQYWQKAAQTFYKSWVGVYPDRSATLKCQMSFGWDFAPPIRTMGIWDEASLIITGPVFIVEASAVGRPISPAPAAVSPATLSIYLTLDADRPRPVKGRVEISPANFTGPNLAPFRFDLALPAGRTVHQLDLHLPEAALWHPWDRGQPAMYRLRIKIAYPDGQPVDEVILRTGICATRREGWRFNVNDRDLFIRGLNWVPADCFPGRIRTHHYSRLLQQVRASGANLVRVWGGGLREKQSFYDLCDELGLLVWQEFPFACMFLGSYPQERAYLSRVEAECSAIVRRLRGHPSLAVWCGGNEFSRRHNRPLLTTLASVVKQHDSERAFIPVSPSFDHGVDRHQWEVWHGGQPFSTYQAETAAFVSELGLQALPRADTLAAALPAPARGWETHHADRPKLERYMAPFLTAGLQTTEDATESVPFAIRHSPFAPSLQTLISASQRAQAAALQTAIEHMRRRKYEAGGVCLWQFNEPWPAISWAIVDYFGRPKLAYDRLKWWYRPLLITLNFESGRRWQAGQEFRAEIWAINDSLDGVSGAELRIDLDGSSIHCQRLNLAPDSAVRAGALAYTLPAPPHRLNLTLRRGDQLLAENSYDLDWFDRTRGSFFQRLRRRIAEWVLR